MGNMRGLAFWGILIILVFALYSAFNGAVVSSNQPDYSDFIKQV